MLEKDLHEVVELRVITKDGREIWVSAMGVRTEYQGRLAGLVSMREITENKRAEERLQASEENYRLLVENATDGIAVIQDGVIKFANPKLAEFALCSVEEIVSRPFTEFIHPDDRQMVAEHYASRLNQENAPRTYQFKALDKEGNTKWAEVSAVLFNWEGRSAILGFLNDVTERKLTEKALIESERRYRLLAENSADVIWTMDMNLRLSYVSPSVARMRGYSVEEAMQATVEEALTPESAEIVLNVIKNMASENRNGGHNSSTSQVLELEMRCKDGSTIWTETTISLIRTADGQPASILGVTRNITQRKRAEEDLLENERRYRLLAENITDVIWVTDMELKPTYISPSVSRLLGYSVEESLAGTLETVMPRSSVEKVSEAFAEVMALAEEQPDTIARPQVTELEFKRKDGSSVWLDTTASFIRDSGGRPVEIMGVLRDITQRRKAEEALKESEERFRHLIETTSDWVWETDENGIYTYVSPMIHEILGYEPEEVLGRTSADIMPSKSANRVAKVFGSAVISGTPFRFVEATYLHKDGRLIIAEISGVPFFDDAGTAVRGYRGIARDITQRKQAEEQLQKSYHNIQKMLEGTIQAITMMVETRDRYTAGHQQRVTQIACAIAQELGLSNKQIQMIRMAGRLHDLGKIFIPIEILSKPGQLNEMELAIIKTHPRASYDILKNIDFPWPIADIVLQHHERINGSGYPAGLRGEDILMEARILAVSDVVEAMSSHRPYRPALGVETALKEIVQNKGILYDPDVVNACLRVFWEKRLVLGEEETAVYTH
jgi:PAS domain S-box-containing protein